MGTNTHERLMAMDPKMSLVVDCILPILAHTLDIPCLRVVENILCEALKWHTGGCTTKFTKHDIILRGMQLYQMRYGVLYKGRGGNSMNREDWIVLDTFDGELYTPLISRWTMNENLSERVLGDEDKTIVVSYR